MQSSHGNYITLYAWMTHKCFCSTALCNESRFCQGPPKCYRLCRRRHSERSWVVADGGRGDILSAHMNYRWVGGGGVGERLVRVMRPPCKCCDPPCTCIQLRKLKKNPLQMLSDIRTYINTYWFFDLTRQSGVEFVGSHEIFGLTKQISKHI